MLFYILVPLGIIVAAALAFLWWRYTSVERGARQRDEKLLPLLDPLAERIAKGHSPDIQEIERLASQRPIRGMLYALLKHFERLELFPVKYLTPEAQGEAILAYWMMHPNELQDAPEEMQLAASVHRDIDGEAADFLVYRYKMPPGHWAADDGWLLGVAGPFVKNDVPYSGLASAFSRCDDQDGKVAPEELVDWYIGMARKVSE